MKERQINGFECPLHGLELEAFCWRAWTNENKELWGEYSLKYKAQLTGEEVDNMITRMQEEQDRQMGLLTFK